MPPYDDSLLGKLIVHADNREAACARMLEALTAFGIDGIRTTLPFLKRVIEDEHFATGRVNTMLLAALSAA
mgnify:CR=1 FL=1